MMFKLKKLINLNNVNKVLRKIIFNLLMRSFFLIDNKRKERR